MASIAGHDGGGLTQLDVCEVGKVFQLFRPARAVMADPRRNPNWAPEDSGGSL